MASEGAFGPEPLNLEVEGLYDVENCTNYTWIGTENETSFCSWNASDEHYGEFGGPIVPAWVHVLLQVLYAIVCIVGLTGNTLVIYVVIRFSKMQTVTNLYIVNLAVADECLLIGIPFAIVTFILRSWPFGSILCKVYMTTTSINQIASSTFLLIMSADRYMAICQPIRAPKWRTPLIAKAMSLTAWAISALLTAPVYMYSNTLQTGDSINCNIFWPDWGKTTGPQIFIIYSAVFSFAIPLVFISIFYVLVIRRLRTVGPRRRPVTEESKSCNPTKETSSRAKERKRSHKKVTKLVLTVITVYFVCWLPYWVSQMILTFRMPDSETPHSDVVIKIFMLAGCLSVANSAMNPILYAFLSDNFRKSFMKACRCAIRKDVNTTLHVENSVLSRSHKHSRRGRKTSAPLTSATFAGSNCPEITYAGTSNTKTTMVFPNSPSLLPSPQSPHVPVGKLIAGLDDFDSNVSNGITILPSTGGTGTQQHPFSINYCHDDENRSNGRSIERRHHNIPEIKISLNETFVQEDGIQVTAL